MLDPLGGRDDREVHDAVFATTLQDFAALFDESLHGFALLTLEAHAQGLADLVETLNVTPGLLKMAGDCLAELFRTKPPWPSWEGLRRVVPSRAHVKILELVGKEVRSGSSSFIVIVLSWPDWREALRPAAQFENIQKSV